MSGSHIIFLADENDLRIIFSRFDELAQFVYTNSLSETNAENDQFDSALPLLDYLVSHQEPVQTNVFMITLPETALYKQEITLHDGSGKKFSLSQNFNQDAAEVLLGGEAAPSTIVQCTLRTTGETNLAKEIFNKLKKEVIRGAKKTGGYYYVLPGALQRLREGWRLTPCIGFARQMDIHEK